MEENARARCVVRDVYRYPTEVEAYVIAVK